MSQLPKLLICIDNEYYKTSLTLDRVYLLLDEGLSDCYMVKDDSGKSYFFPKKCFKRLGL